MIDRHHALLRSAISDGGGIVVSTEGDAFFAVFIDAREAVLAAAEAQRRLAAEGWPQDGAVRVRMGLHTGMGRLGGDDYAGVEVNRAARISSAGHGGQVLVSASTADLVTTALPVGLSLRDVGAIMLKGFDDAQPVSQLEIRELPIEFPPLRADRPGYLPEPLTSFLGRDTVGHALRLVREERLVTLTGPGGTGKTRISTEAARQLQPEFRGGAWFVRLETIRDRSLVLPEDRGPHRRAGRTGPAHGRSDRQRRRRYADAGGARQPGAGHRSRPGPRATTGANAWTAHPCQ